jgi:Kdo2-lipid IVA lauroyltransferase/acyltransferase
VRVRDVRYRIEYGAVLMVRALVRLLPDASVRALGTLIGLTFYVCDPAHRRLAVRQLRAAFPLRSDAECRAIARATFAHFGRLLVILLKFSTLSADEIRARVEFDGDERVRTALAAGKGVLLFSGHFGFWELQGMAHPLALPPMSVLARPLDNPYLHALLERTRRATGNQVIYRRGAVRRILRALEADECVATMIDQHIQPADAVMVEFFNRPAATTSALATLALRTGAPVIPVFALPLPGGRYRMIYDHPVELPAADSGDPIRELTQRCTDVLEMYVRRHPHLWLWMHRRWRDADDETRGMFPAAAPDDRVEAQTIEE